MSTIEVIHDGPDGSTVVKKFTDVEKAKEYAQGKVYQGGPAKIQAEDDKDAKGETPPRRRAHPEPESDEPPRRKKKASAKPKARPPPVKSKPARKKS